MKAIRIESHADEPKLAWADEPDPTAAETEVLVEVRATGVNRADLLQARGQYPVPAGASPILGLELAGTVLEVPAHSRGVRVGQRVCALVSGGGYAQRAVVDARMLMGLPESWSYEQGAAVPEAWLTAYVNLFWEGELSEGESVLIHAGGSGVGTAAVQLARAVGARVFVTAGTSEKCQVCRSLGAEVAVNYKEQDFQTILTRETEERGVDLILDPVGADYLERNLSCLARHGRMVQIGLLSGSKATLDMALILRKNLVIRGSTLRPRPLEEKIRITREFQDRFWDSLVDGTLKPVIDRSFPIEKAQQAHSYVRENRNVGKVILTVGD
jgi:putative PIG3 family NAD(P)H quinone oxidoreductase